MKRSGVILLLLLAYLSSSAQAYREIIDKNKDLPFNQIVEKVNAFYGDKYVARGSEYKQFKRWEFFNQRRLDEHGRIQNVPKRLLEEFTKYQSAYQPPVHLNYDCNWQSLGGPAYELIVSGHNGGLGRVNCITFDPANSSIIYVGTPVGGLWRSDNGGGTWNPGSTTSNWTPLSDGLPNIGVSGIAIDPNSPTSSRTLYILTGDGDGGQTPSIGVLKSLDGGATWYQTGLTWGNSQFIFAYKLIMHPTNANILFAATDIGIFRTQDAGITWTNEQNGRFFDIEFKPGDPTTMYATTANNFFRSTDTGDNWTAVNCGLTNTGIRMAIAVTPANANYVYVLSGGNLLDGMGNNMAGTFRGLYRSTDSGQCFTVRSTTPNILDNSQTGNMTRQQAGYDLSIAVSTTNAELVQVGGINCWRSNDGGQNWVRTTYWNESTTPASDYNHADVHALEYLGGTLYSGSDGGIYMSTNDADDWSNISQGLKITQFYRIAAFTDGADYIVGGAQDNGLNQFVDSGAGFGNLQHWEGGDGFECTVDTGNDLIFGDNQNGGINRYNYMTNAFTDVTPAAAGSGAWLTPIVFDAVNGVLLGGYQDIWTTNDSGGSWTNLTNGNIGAGLCSHIALAPSNASVIYVSKYLGPGASMYRSNDGGTTWTQINGTLPVGNNVITYFAIHPTDANRIWVTLGGFAEDTNEGYQAGNKVYMSTDGGANWQNISGTLPNLPANCIIYENGSANGLYVGMDVGVYYRDDNMSDWLLFSNDLPNVIINELDINYTTNKLYAGTFGRGVWCSDLFSACNRVCLNCPNFSGLQSPSNTYYSENCIYSSAEVFDSTSIVYQAEEFILLQDKFHADAVDGSLFQGRINTCNPAANLIQVANLRDLPGFYIGHLPNLPNQSIASVNRNNASPFKVYPNPTLGSINVESDLNQRGLVEITLYDITGRKLEVLHERQYEEQGPFSKQFDIHQLKNGTFIVEFNYNGMRSFQTILKIDHTDTGNR